MMPDQEPEKPPIVGELKISRPLICRRCNQEFVYQNAYEKHILRHAAAQ